MDIREALDQEIQAVCPIEGVSFGKIDDRKTWRIDYAKEANNEQKKKAQEVLEKFEWNEKKQAELERQEKIEEYKKDKFSLFCFDIYKKLNNPDATIEEFMDYLEKLENA